MLMLIAIMYRGIANAAESLQARLAMQQATCYRKSKHRRANQVKEEMTA